MAQKAKKRQKGAPRSKSPGANDGPARQRYWSEKKLEKKKVRHLVKYNGMTKLDAQRFWREVRKTRVR